MKFSLLPIVLFALTAPSHGQCPQTLSIPRSGLSATGVGGMVLFAGGSDGSSSLSSAVVDLYQVSSGTWSTASLSNSRTGLAATSVGGLALFGGGGRWSGNFQFLLDGVVDVFDPTSGGWTVMGLSQPRMFLAATAVSGKALFAGGIATGQPPLVHSDVVDIYDSLTASWSTAQLSQPRRNLVAAAAGNLALFAGGHDGSSPVATVDIYDGATNLWSTSQLSVARDFMAATALGSRVYFAGGTQLVGTQGIPSDVVDVYDTATGLWTVLQLSAPRTAMAATTVGGRVLFAGGIGLDGLASARVDVLERANWSTQSLVESRHSLAAASAAGEALIGGGQSTQLSAMVERFSVGFPRSFCFGDGSGNVCPCGNQGGPSTGCANSASAGARLEGSGCNSITGDSLVFSANGLPPGQSVLFFVGSNSLGGATGVFLGDGLRCVGGAIRRLGLTQASAGGSASWGPGLIAPGGWNAGDVRRFQAWYRDPAGPCGTGSNLSSGIEVGFLP